MKNLRLNTLLYRVVLIGLLFYTNSAYSQKLMKHGDSFIYESKIYSMSELDSIFALSPNAYTEFLAYKNDRKKASNYIAYSALYAAATICSVIIYSNNKKNYTGILDGILIAPIQLGLIGVGTITSIGTIGYFIKYDSKNQNAIKHLNKAIDFINQKDFGSLENNQNFEIALGPTCNGLGITYSF